MTTAATSLLGLALPVSGELSGTWGDTVNTSITALLDSAVAGTTTISADADITLTATTLATNEARQAVILWTAGGTVTRYITAPAQSKTYVVVNKTSSTQSIVIRGAGPTTGVTVVAGRRVVVVWDGADFVEVASGNVNGGASSTDNAIARFDGTTGKIIQNSLATISDAGVLAGVTDISGTPTLSSGTANGVVYLNGVKSLTAGNALTFDGTKLSATQVAQTSDKVAFGLNAGLTTQGANAVAVGTDAGGSNQGANAVAIGLQAGYVDQPANTVIINATGTAVNGVAAQTDSFYVAPVRATTTGSSVLFYNSTTKEVFTSARATGNNIFLGNGAGSTVGNSERVAIGTSAGATNQSGYAIAIGQEAGQTNQGGFAIAIGRQSALTSQGQDAITIGRVSGQQQGAYAIALGTSSGYIQGAYGIALGYNAGQQQGAYAVAIGNLSGAVGAGASSVAIGDQAGYAGSQGYSISIGYKAGYSSLSSATNAIILNATGAELSGVVNQSNSFYVAPIRTDSTAVANSLRYNTTTKEVTYTDTIGYAAGSGGTVTQATSRTTGVTLNKLSGAITLFSAAGSAGTTTFTVTNSTVTAADTIIVNQKTGSNLYVIFVTAVATGSFNISFFAISGVATEAPVFNFNVIRGSTS